jgi:hypothetical protein
VEELGADVAIGDRIETVRWEYPEKTVLLHFYRCTADCSAIQPLEGQALAWVAPERLGDYAFPDADRALIARLRRG